MTTANVTTEGRADSLQKRSRTSRAQWAHQVTAAALFSLQKKAYTAYQDNTPALDILPFPVWCEEMESNHPQFCYWNTVLLMELIFLQFLKSQREANFELYVEALGMIIPWMFAMDHYHYARWLTIHVRDLMNLQDQCPLPTLNSSEEIL
jgi:hypothetical protein